MKLLLTLSLSFAAFSAFAGTPDEDFTVDLTRESFSDGVKPSEKDLYVNFQWVCGTYRTNEGTQTGTTGITLNEVFFQKKADGIYNHSLYFASKTPLSENDKEYFNTVETQNSGEYSYAIRKNHGGLLIERGISVGDSSPLVPSIAFPGFHALTYTYCLPYQYESKAPKIMNIPWGDVWSND